jgi:hypothetical protein
MDTHGPDEPLVPTIGWRVVHLALWTDIYREWTFGVKRHVLTEANIESRRPTHYGTTRPAGDLVWDVAVEHLHHGAEVGLLRDLIRGKARPDRYPGPWS